MNNIEKLKNPELKIVRDKWLGKLNNLFEIQVIEPVEMSDHCPPSSASPFFLNGIAKYSEEYDCDWEKWLDDSLNELADESEKSLDESVFRPLCINFNPHGVHFIDFLFGADVFQLEDKSWQVRPLDSPIGSLQKPDLESHQGWLLMKKFAEKFLSYNLETVVFGLPTIASVLNVAVNLYGQEILLEMIINPEAAKHDFEIISDVICDIHKWYLKNIPADILQCIIPHERHLPVGYGQLCGCTTQLISEQQYIEFISQHDGKLLSIYPNGGMIHLCGTHSQQIPEWRKMKSLRAVQINDDAAEDLELYFKGLRDDQIIYVNVCEGMSKEKIMEITGGKRVVII